MQWKPHVTVAAIIEEEGKFLLVQENINNNLLYNQPAGRLEEGESMIEAIKREVMEETARQFTPEALTGVYLFKGKHPAITYLRFCFAGACSSFNADQQLDEGIVASKWLSRNEIAHSALRTELVLKSIDDYLKGEQYPLTLLHDLNITQ